MILKLKKSATIFALFLFVSIIGIVYVVFFYSMVNEQYHSLEHNDVPPKSGTSFNKNEYEKRLSVIAAKKTEFQKEQQSNVEDLMVRLFEHESNNTTLKKEAWENIEGYLQEFNNNPYFVESGETNLLAEIKKSENRLKEPMIYQAAALLLANFEKGGSPYRGLSGYENKGLWVKALLGDAHYNHFLEDKQKCINDLKDAGEAKNQLEDILDTCEMHYIINNINETNRELPYFGYNNNLAGSLLPKEFADRLSQLSRGLFSRSSVKEEDDSITHNDFKVATSDFYRFLKTSRFPSALANLSKMLSLTKAEKDKAESYKAFLVCMLSGVLDFNGKNDMRGQVYQRGKTLGFLPGMLVKNIGHSEQVVELLNDFSNGDFSNHVKSFFHKSDLLNGETKIGKLIEELNGWWSVDRMNEFEQYSRSEFPKKIFPNGSALDKLQKSVLSQDSSINSVLLKH